MQSKSTAASLNPPIANANTNVNVNVNAQMTQNTYIWIVLGLTVAAQTAGSIVSQGVYTLVPFWKEAFNLTLAQASLAVTFMNGGQILSMIGLGKAIDRYGERSVVSVTMIGMGLMAIAASMFAASYSALLFCLVLLGMCYASVQPGGTRAIIRWFPPHKRGLATGFRQAAVPLGTSIAAFMLPAIAAHQGWQMAVMVQGFVGIAAGIFFWMFYREDTVQLSMDKKAVQPSLKQTITYARQDKAFLPILFAGVAMCAFQFTFTASAIPFMVSKFHISLVFSASLLALTQVIGIPGRILIPYIADRFWPGRRERVLGCIMLICVLITLVYLFLPTDSPNWLLGGTLAILGFFGVGWFPLYILQIAEIAPKNAIASTISFASTMTMIAMALVPFIFGSVADWAGYTAAWGLLILPVALLVPWLLRLPKRVV